MRISPDGSQSLVVQAMDESFGVASDDASRFTPTTTRPNGLAFDATGNFLISNFGTDRLERMSRDGSRTEVLLDRIDGQPAGKVNFVLRDRRGRTWIPVSMRIRNWMSAISPNVADGYVAVLDERGARIVADGFAFTNEIRFDAEERWLYVIETSGRRITRLRIGANAEVEEREVFGPSDAGGFIDGIAFDVHGNLWGTHVMSDRIFALTPEGDMRVILEDHDAEASAALYAAFQRDEATPELMLAAGGTLTPWFASVTFGGPDLRRVYIGSLRGTDIPWFDAPVAGLPIVHWDK
ncbi:SMP-30/gluconolactonase/LRE family protein [uncultured Paracoccus sp.]|uniref:SMP-30/gluconolactonase/LRE family protein n=1 Tax=uncultured Paracoccus sp. TaxID=189685 RepID=UPI00261337E5|nr:SMP-30/gluconolactonase/LRE family protein [uncultured Paracoccus sp.]